jgi:hypothetical protein
VNPQPLTTSLHEICLLILSSSPAGVAFFAGAP